MKILLANPSYKVSLDKKYEKYFIRSGSRWPHSGVKRKGTIPHYLPFPFYLAYSAALLKNNGFDVDVLDAIALDMDEEKFIEYIRKTSPEYLLFEITTPTVNYDLFLVDKLKNIFKDLKIIVTGAHPTVFPEEILKNSKVDFVLRGEYEEILLNLMNTLKNNGDLLSVKGIAFKKGENIVKTPETPLIEPLDKLPYPLREYFPAAWKSKPTIYWDGFCQMRPAIQMHASRGCPYRCDFCLWNQVIYRSGKYRTFSTKRVVDEMEYVKNKYGAREIYFDDDDFTINKNFVIEACEEIKKRNLKIKWSCMGDAININKRVMEKMSEAGCIGIKFGVESGSERVLKYLGKPVDLKKVRQIVRWCEYYKIKTHATFSLGLYNDDKESIEETKKFIYSLNVDTIQLSISTPFPGTEFYKKAEEDGFLRTKEWGKYDGKASEVYTHPKLEWKYVEQERKEILRNWLFYRLLSFSWIKRQFFYFFRLLNGLGLVFILKQVLSVVIDEKLSPKHKEKL